MATYIVTGGAGFIGSNICRELVKRGERVRVIDNFATGRRQNLHDLEADIELIEADICDTERMKRAFQGADYVLHQAAIPSVPRSIADPLTSNRVNVEGTLSILTAARDSGVKRVVYAASSSAYGNADVEYKHENLPPSPLSPYALAKHTGEVYCRLFYQLYGLETVCLRYFNVFGQYQNPKSQYAAVIPRFITLMLQGQSPTIHGDGTQSRDFTHVHNNVAANILAATSDKGAGEIFNIACGESTSLNDLVAAINESLGTAIEPIYIESRAGDVKHSKAKIQKAVDTIGYKPHKSFQQGLEETIQWYKNVPTPVTQ